MSLLASSLPPAEDEASRLVQTDRYVFMHNTEALRRAEAQAFRTRTLMRNAIPGPTLARYTSLVMDCYQQMSLGRLLTRPELDELATEGTFTPARREHPGLTLDAVQGLAWLPQAVPKTPYVKFKRREVRHRAVFVERLAAIDSDEALEGSLYTWQTVGEGFALDAVGTGRGRMDMLLFGEFSAADIEFVALGIRDYTFYGPALAQRGIEVLPVTR